MHSKAVNLPGQSERSLKLHGNKTIQGSKGKSAPDDPLEKGKVVM